MCDSGSTSRAAEAAGGGAGSVRAAAERRRRRGERGGTRPGRDGVDRRRGGAQVQRHERLVDGVRHVEEMVDELVRAVEEDPARLQQRLPGMAGRFDEEREQVAEDVRQRQRRRQRRDEERPAARRSEAAGAGEGSGGRGSVGAWGRGLGRLGRPGRPGIGFFGGAERGFVSV